MLQHNRNSEAQRSGSLRLFTVSARGVAQAWRSTSGRRTATAAAVGQSVTKILPKVKEASPVNRGTGLFYYLRVIIDRLRFTFLVNKWIITPENEIV